jgi:hypothetical protein
VRDRVIRSIVVMFATMLATACDAEGPIPLPAPCFQAGAEEGLYVQIIVTGRLVPDFYTITVDADGQAPSVMFALQQGLGSAGFAEAVTAAGKHLQVEADLEASAGDAWIDYAEGGGPANLAIEIANSAGVFAHSDFTPSYQLDEPNGPQCLPHAHNASAAMIISP